MLALRGAGRCLRACTRFLKAVVEPMCFSVLNPIHIQNHVSQELRIRFIELNWTKFFLVESLPLVREMRRYVRLEGAALR